MKLKDYPDAIFEQEKKTDAASDAALALEGEILSLETLFTSDAASDESLTNNAKRKAYIEERKETSQDYQALSQRLQKAQARLRDERRVLKRLENAFTVAKIYARAETAERLRKADLAAS